MARFLVPVLGVGLVVGLASAVLGVHRSRWFRIDGQWARIPLGAQPQNFTLERTPAGVPPCAAQPAVCGIIGVGGP